MTQTCTCTHNESIHNHLGCHKSIMSDDDVLENYNKMSVDEFLNLDIMCKCNMFEITIRDFYNGMFGSKR